MARGQCRLWKNTRTDRSRGAALARWGDAAKYSLPDLYKSGGIGDAKPAVQAVGALDHVGRCHAFGRAGGPWRRARPRARRH